MSTDNHKTTFWEFLGNYSIEIPIIQRDYAQGREGKESLRKSFLEDLKDALDQQKEMKLDFVYGSTENGKLYPLDGQQRLTTLWLLHWYIALKSGKLKEAADRLKKFTYETRISSRSFCEELCNPEHFKNFDCSIGVVEFITNQTWFYSAWEQDPTIQSMLRMLGGGGDSEVTDGLEKAFNYSHRHPSVCQHRLRHLKQRRFIRYYNKLTTTRCPIVFYYLEKDFGNSDDLYIKMNARGEQLTSFENFKADLIGYITKQAENNEDWKKLLDPENGIPISMDTDWTDVFWKNKSIGIDDGSMVNRIDEIYFAFLNRFFWNELFIKKVKDKDKDTYILNIGKGDESSTQENENVSYKYLNDSNNPNDYDKKIAYKGLDPYKYFKNSIPLEFFQKLQRVMDNLTKYLGKYALPECAWDKGFFFIPEYVQESKKNKKIENNSSEDILEVTVLTQVQRIVFFAICKYFDHDEKSCDDVESLKHWLRVVWNLVSGEDKNGDKQIRSTQAMRSAIEFIDKLDSHNVHQSLICKLDNAHLFLSLNSPKNLNDSDFDKRCKEEMAKAHQIIIDNPRDDGKTWQKVIEEAENTAFFRGSIRFLFQDANDAIDWNNFDKKWENAKRYFDENGVVEDYKVLLTKSLVIQCDNWNAQLYDKQVFNPNASTWKWILCSSIWKAPIHNILMEAELDNIQCTKTLNEDKVDKEITPIIGEIPYKTFIEEEPSGRFRGTERPAYYKPYGRNCITFDFGDFQRNKILREIAKKEGKVKIENKEINDSNLSFWWGWDINFEYEGHCFKWLHSPSDKELDIYLMKNNWENYKPRTIKIVSKGTDEDNFYCFRVTKEMESDTSLFAEELDRLIAQARTNDSETMIHKNCQERICEQTE